MGATHGENGKGTANGHDGEHRNGLVPNRNSFRGPMYFSPCIVYIYYVLEARRTQEPSHQVPLAQEPVGTQQR